MICKIGIFEGQKNLVNKKFNSYEEIEINILNNFNIYSDYLELNFSLLPNDYNTYNYLELNINNQKYYYFINDYVLLAYGDNKVIRVFVELDLLKTNENYINNTSFNLIRSPIGDDTLYDNEFSKQSILDKNDFSLFITDFYTNNVKKGMWFMGVINNIKLSEDEKNELYETKNIFNESILTQNESVNLYRLNNLIYIPTNDLVIQNIADSVIKDSKLNSFIKSVTFVPFYNENIESSFAKDIILGETQIITEQTKLSKSILSRVLIARINVNNLFNEFCKDITKYRDSKFHLMLPLHKLIELNYYDLFSNVGENKRVYIDVYYITNVLTGESECIMIDNLDTIIYSDSFNPCYCFNFDSTNQLEVNKNSNLNWLSMISNSIQLISGASATIGGVASLNPMLLGSGIGMTTSGITNLGKTLINESYNRLSAKIGNINNSSNFIYKYTPKLYSYYYPYINHNEEIGQIGYACNRKTTCNINGSYTINNNFPIEYNINLITKDKINKLKELLTIPFLIKKEG